MCSNIYAYGIFMYMFLQKLKHTRHVQLLFIMILIIFGIIFQFIVIGI